MMAWRIRLVSSGLLLMLMLVEHPSTVSSCVGIGSSLNTGTTLAPEIAEGEVMGEIFRPLGAEGADKKCLHGNAAVLLDDGRTTLPVAQLEIGDKVMAYSADKGVHSSTIIDIPVAIAEMNRIFVVFDTGSGSKVIVTPEHGIFVGKCPGSSELGNPTGHWELKAAGALKIGECVPRLDNGKLMADCITDLYAEELNGVYQPITEAGTLFVGNITISAHDVPDGKGTADSEGFIRSENNLQINLNVNPTT